ncbi:gfo/Idh/MocA family oxidoreductase, partial [Pseudomonas sp. FW306-02-F02-AB]
WGSDTDAELFGDFIDACLTDKPTPIDHIDGIRAALVAIAGYESLKTGQPVAV